jgi:hypothetical protein
MEISINGINKFGVIGVVKEFDYTNFGLFVNLTVAGTVSTGGYLGGYSGNGASSYLIRKSGTTLTGIGLATIATSYTEAPGFIFSGQTIGSQLNFVDVTTKPKTSNTSLGSQLSSGFESNIALLAQGSSVLSSVNNFSDATIGCYGLTKYLNLTETQTLDQISYNAMAGLGRPVQTNPAYVVSSMDLREGKTPITNATSTALTKVLLNSTYPMAVKGQRIYCPNVSGGAVMYQKTENSGEWMSVPYTPVL